MNYSIGTILRWTCSIPAAKDDVVSLLSITTSKASGWRYHSSLQPKSGECVGAPGDHARGQKWCRRGETGEEGGHDHDRADPAKSEKVIGVLFIQNRLSHSYSNVDLATLQTLADQCGGALERVRAEDELRHSQRRFRDLFENSPDAIFVEDLDGNVLDANATACALHGLTREQIIGKNAIEELVPADYREMARAQFQKLASGQMSWFEGESLRADNRTVPVEIRGVRIEFEGRPALLFHVRDVIERRAAEMALRSSETLFRSVWENSVDGMRLTDENGMIVAVNSAFCRLVGMTQEQLEGKPFNIVYTAAADWESMRRSHREDFKTGKTKEKTERQFTMHDGRQVVFEIADSFVESGGKPRLFVEPVPGHDAAQTAGRTIAAVAKAGEHRPVGRRRGARFQKHPHDQPRPCDAVDDGDNGCQGALASANQIKLASERAAGLTRQLLAFGRKQIVNQRPLDLNRVVGGMKAEMLGRLLGEDIALRR